MIDHVKILGVDFSIVEAPLVHSDTDTIAGRCNKCTFQIEINSQLSDEAKLLTLLHEATHGYLGITGHADMVKPQREEMLCNAIALFMYDFIRNNPRIVNAIAGKNVVKK